MFLHFFSQIVGVRAVSAVLVGYDLLPVAFEELFELVFLSHQALYLHLDNRPWKLLEIYFFKFVRKFNLFFFGFEFDFRLSTESFRFHLSCFLDLLLRIVL